MAPMLAMVSTTSLIVHLKQRIETPLDTSIKMRRRAPHLKQRIETLRRGMERFPPLVLTLHLKQRIETCKRSFGGGPGGAS